MDIDTVDLEQYGKLKQFKSSIRDKGIQEEYRDIHELREKLSRHLTIVLRDMQIGPVIDKRVVEAAKASTREQEVVPSAAAHAPYLEEKTPRSFLIRGGNTAAIEGKLTAAGGKLTSLQTGGKAWVFSNGRLEEVAKLLKIKPVIRPKNDL
ncbi:hypothetical protein [Rhizobium sp. MHM7A]|uniref:hypothetical protein n=1 Tax=Rhizobium sp. MHM7A TaxID=2583233 RepID=UPI001106089E|nr:hypothetical protein [Rhizobium sp. MHM7A]TLX12086.1 hypothetical protein FFR93_16065 [Rhizobium sp. MHM7A]